MVAQTPGLVSSVLFDEQSFYLDCVVPARAAPCELLYRRSIPVFLAIAILPIFLRIRQEAWLGGHRSPLSRKLKNLSFEMMT